MGCLCRRPESCAIAVFPGGFLSVDIFFAISCYLMAGLIEEALDSDRFTFKGFYARRARHAQPARTRSRQALYLKRQRSLPVSTMSQWWVSRSSSVVVILASPNADGHSQKARLVVTMIEVRS